MPVGAKIGLLIACLFWAISFIATKVALAAAPPLTVVAARLCISALCFVAWFALTRRWPRIADRRQLTTLFGLSLIGTGLHYGIQTVGLQYTSAANGSLYAVTGPIAIALLAALAGERLTRRKLAGIALALTGVLVVLGVDTLRAVEWRGHLLGDLLVFVSIFLWGLFTVAGKQVTDRLGALEMTGTATIIGALWMLPVAAGELWWRSFSLAAISARAWLAIAFLGVTCSFAATLLYFAALARSESQRVGVYLYLIPPLTYTVAGLYLHEPIGLNLLGGSLLVLAGVYLTERS